MKVFTLNRPLTQAQVDLCKRLDRRDVPVEDMDEWRLDAHRDTLSAWSAILDEAATLRTTITDDTTRACIRRLEDVVRMLLNKEHP